MPKQSSNVESRTQLRLLVRLAAVDDDDDEDMEEGDDGTEFECDDEGGVSKSGNDSSGSLSFSSLSQSIRSSRSVKLMIFRLSLIVISSTTSMSSLSMLHIVSSLLMMSVSVAVDICQWSGGKKHEKLVIYQLLSCDG